MEGSEAATEEERQKRNRATFCLRTKVGAAAFSSGKSPDEQDLSSRASVTSCTKSLRCVALTATISATGPGYIIIVAGFSNFTIATASSGFRDRLGRQQHIASGVAALRLVTVDRRREERSQSRWESSRA